MWLKHAQISRFTSYFLKSFASGGAKGAWARPWTPSRFARALRALEGDASRRSSFAQRRATPSRKKFYAIKNSYFVTQPDNPIRTT